MGRRSIASGVSPFDGGGVPMSTRRRIGTISAMNHPEQPSSNAFTGGGSEFPTALKQVLAVAIPMMISTGMFSLTLFVDRTFLLWYDGTSMGASLAAGNLYWVAICIPVGIASMTGAIVSQYAGAGRDAEIGRFMWQSVWMTIAALPAMALIAFYADDLFRWSGQDEALWDAETQYLRLLLIGSAGSIIETALSGFFSGLHRTRTIVWVSTLSMLVNLGLDVPMIFGTPAWPDPIRFLPGGNWEGMGIAGAGIASVISFYFKAGCYAMILLGRGSIARRYQTRNIAFDFAMFRKLMYFGVPTGLMYVTESGAFTLIVLQIGRLGDLPLRASTMALNFNMVAFIPLVGVSIAASVVIGQTLARNDQEDPPGPSPENEPFPTASTPRLSPQSVGRAALLIAGVYALGWALVYALMPNHLLGLYRITPDDDPTNYLIATSTTLLGYVAAYIIGDALQLTMAGVLRGAGDTWFVWAAGLTASVLALAVGWGFGPPVDDPDGLWFWWGIIMLWIWLLTGLMTIRYFSGRWLRFRMV